MNENDERAVENPSSIARPSIVAMADDSKRSRAAKKKRRPTQREEFVDYVVEIDGSDWGTRFFSTWSGVLSAPTRNSASRCDEVPIDGCVLAPGEHGVAGELGAIVGRDHSWLAASLDVVTLSTTLRMRKAPSS